MRRRYAGSTGQLGRWVLEMADREMGRPPRVLIVGGGIAGLATARALLRHRIKATIVERSAAWSHLGAGMYLPANSVRALRTLGLQAPALERGYQIGQQRFLDHRGSVLVKVDLPAVWGATGLCVAIGRGDLHEILRQGIAVRMDTAVTSVEQDRRRVHAVFNDGSSSDYDAVVGADGVRSRVRTMTLGGAQPRLVGQASWRFIINGFPGISAWTVRLGRGRTFLTLPLGDNRTYCYADVNTAGAADPTGGDPARLAEVYRDFADPVGEMLKLGSAAGSKPYYSPIEEVIQEPWVRGRVALVGDAAHATSPNMAEGAGMALEDAFIIAETIAEGRPLSNFEARRRPRIQFVQAQTHRRDSTRNLPRVIRNATLRLAGQRIFRDNYRPLLADP